MQAKLFRHTNAAKASKDGLDYTNLSSQREIKYNKHFGANETYKIDSMLTVSNKTNEFLSALEMYATNRSVIEAIVSSRENCFPWKTNHPAIIIEPIKIVLTDGNQVRRIRQINEFFDQNKLNFDQNKLKKDIDPTAFNSENYAQMLVCLPFQERSHVSRILLIEKKQQQVFRTGIISDYTLQAQNPEALRPIDLLLIELKRLKQRKHQDQKYQKYFVQKLQEFMECVLKDNKEYAGLSFVEKIRKCYKQIAQFKGKLHQGQPIISLLKIFFLEYCQYKVCKALRSDNNPASQSFLSLSQSQKQVTGNKQQKMSQKKLVKQAKKFSSVTL